MEELKEHSIVFFLLGDTWKMTIRSAQAQGVTDLCHSQILKRDYVTGWKSNIFREKKWFEVSVGSMRSADPSLKSNRLLLFSLRIKCKLVEERIPIGGSKSLLCTHHYHFEMFSLTLLKDFRKQAIYLYIYLRTKEKSFSLYNCFYQF
jgi:hypothetical protein